MESAQGRLLLNKEKIIERWVKLCREKLPAVQDCSNAELIEPISKFLDQLCTSLKTDTNPSGKKPKHFALLSGGLPTTFTEYELLFGIIRNLLNETGGYTLQEFEIISTQFWRAARESVESYSGSTSEQAYLLFKKFVTTMSHEIRTPLNAVLGFTDLMRNESLSKRERLSYTDIVARNGKALSNLVDHLLDTTNSKSEKAATGQTDTNIQDERGPVPVRYASDKTLKDVNILLVEDMKDNQLLIETYLRKTGALLDIANDGAEGVKKALSKKYDVILMDIQMPVMDGNSAARTLREAGYDRPVIALTAHAMKDEIDRSIRAGFNSLVSKPIDSKKLFEVIRSALRQAPAY